MNETLADLLESIGRLRAHDAAATKPPGTPDRAAIAATLGRAAMTEALEDAAVRLVRLLVDDLVVDGRSDGEREPPVELRALLSVRDRAEYEVLGAAFLLDVEPAEVEGWSPTRIVFDAIVKPECWRLVAFNDVRQEVLGAISERHRARFYWWKDGAGVDPSAVSALAAAAQLVATFPNARARFEALVRAQSAWTAPRTKLATVTKLRAWLTRATVDTPLAFAAAEGDEHTILTTNELEISFGPPNRLIVDLLSDRRPAAQPSLRTASGRVVPVEPVAGAEERFMMLLPPDVMDGEATLTLSVPLVVGDLDLVLPPSRA